MCICGRWSTSLQLPRQHLNGPTSGLPLYSIWPPYYQRKGFCILKQLIKIFAFVYVTQRCLVPTAQSQFYCKLYHETHISSHTKVLGSTHILVCNFLSSIYLLSVCLHIYQKNSKIFLEAIKMKDTSLKLNVLWLSVVPVSQWFVMFMMLPIFILFFLILVSFFCKYTVV